MPAGQKRLKGLQRQKQLLDVAKQLFLERGYTKTTTAAMAKMAGVTEPILYRHFRGKKDLFLAVMREFLAEEEQHWRSILDKEMSLREKWETVLGYVGGPEGSVFCKILCSAILEGQHDKEIKAGATAMIRVRRDRFAALVDETRSAGLLRVQADTDSLVLVLLGLHFGVVAASKVYEGARPIDEVVERTLGAFAATMFGGPAGAT